MAKTIVIGQKETRAKKLTPIEFERILSESLDMEMGTYSKEPDDFKYIELICKNYTDDVDLMFAYDNPNKRGDGVLFAGKWNDGVVEQHELLFIMKIRRCDNCGKVNPKTWKGNERLCGEKGCLVGEHNPWSCGKVGWWKFQFPIRISWIGFWRLQESVY